MKILQLTRGPVIASLFTICSHPAAFSPRRAHRGHQCSRDVGLNCLRSLVPPGVRRTLEDWHGRGRDCLGALLQSSFPGKHHSGSRSGLNPSFWAVESAKSQHQQPASLWAIWNGVPLTCIKVRETSQCAQWKLLLEA